MADLIAWDPWHDLRALRAEIEGPIDRAATGKDNAVGPPWRPVADVIEPNHTTVITAELPGCNDEDVHVVVQGRVLAISRQRILEQDTADAHYRRRERSCGEFQRSFELSEGAEASDVNAQVAYGVLKITIDRGRQGSGAAIPVTGGD